MMRWQKQGFEDFKLPCKKYLTRSNQRLGSAFYRICGVIMANWLCKEYQKGNYSHAFLAGRADLNRCTRKRGPRPLKKLRGKANLRLRNEIRMGSLVRRENNKKVKTYDNMN